MKINNTDITLGEKICKSMFYNKKNNYKFSNFDKF